MLARPYGSFRLVVTLGPSSSAALLPTHLSSTDTSRSISQVISCFCVTFIRWQVWHSLLYIIHDDMTFSGEIKSGVPSFHLPPFSFERPVSNSSNSTNPDTEWVTFDTILSDLGMGLAMVPIIAILEQVAIAQAFCELLSSNSQFPFVCFVMKIVFYSQWREDGFDSRNDCRWNGIDILFLFRVYAVDSVFLSQLGHVCQRRQNTICQFLQRYFLFAV